jgi:hypothetical protein
MKKNTIMILSLIVVALVSVLSPAFARDVRTVTFGNGLWLEQDISLPRVPTGRLGLQSLGPPSRATAGWR